MPAGGAAVGGLQAAGQFRCGHGSTPEHERHEHRSPERSRCPEARRLSEKSDKTAPVLVQAEHRTITHGGLHHSVQAETWAGSLILLRRSGLALWTLTNRKRAVGGALFGTALVVTAGLGISALSCRDSWGLTPRCGGDDPWRRVALR